MEPLNRFVVAAIWAAVGVLVHEAIGYFVGGETLNAALDFGIGVFTGKALI